jgi:SAM-dependent methyltransferase
MTKTLDLGCGNTPKNPYNADELYGVDIVDVNTPNTKKADLAIEPIPYEDNSFDYVTAYDFLEHIPRILYIDGKRTQPFIDVMSEIYRVLKPGGIFRAHTPCYPHAPTFQDPTHVNFITDYTVEYFSGEALKLGQLYGFKGEFKLLKQEWDPRWTYLIVWELEAVK